VGNAIETDLVSLQTMNIVLHYHQILYAPRFPLPYDLDCVIQPRPNPLHVGCRKRMRDSICAVMLNLFRVVPEHLNSILRMNPIREGSMPFAVVSSSADQIAEGKIAHL
jgi:hypothetical protein